MSMTRFDESPAGGEFIVAGRRVNANGETLEQAAKSGGLDDLTVAELREQLDARGIEYAASARKADLIQLINEAG